MYLYNLPSKVQSFIAILIAILLLYFIYFVFLNFFMLTYLENNEQIKKHRILYSRLQQEYVRIDIFAKNTQHNKYNKNRLDFFSGNSSEAIQAKILNRVKVFATNNGAQFRTSRQLPLKNGSLGIRVELFGTLNSIKKTIHAVEVSKPFLIVEKLHLNPLLNNLNKSRTDTIMLNTQLDIYGIIWSEKK